MKKICRCFAWGIKLFFKSIMFNKFLKVLRLNVIFTRVILLSFLVICSVPNKIFSITFWSSWTMKCFKPCLPGAVCICYDKWIFSNRSIHAVPWKNIHKVIRSVLILYTFEGFNLEIAHSFGHFLYSIKKIT